MKWLNIKNILALLLIACAVLSFYFGRTVTFTLMQAVGIVAVLFFVIFVLVFVPKRTSEQELIE